jgi:hypothetical protein
MSAANVKETVYVAFDIEAGGSGYQHPVIAVGVCHGTVGDYKRKRWCIRFNANTFEKRCVDEFWSKNQNILGIIEREAMDEDVAWKEIADFIDSLELLYPASTYRIKFVSDNPAYDIARIDYMLYVKRGRLPLRYTTEGKYRSISDPSEQVKGLPPAQRAVMDELVTSAKNRASVSHTHLPDDDAEVMFLEQAIIDRIISL